MSNEEKQIISQFKKMLENNVSLLEFRLFGSRAKKKASEYSDYDFFIVIETKTPEMMKKIRDIAWEIAFEHNTFINTVVCSRKEMKGRMKNSLIYQLVTREGISL